MVAIFALALAKPPHVAAQPLPLLEKAGKSYVMAARSTSHINCYQSDFSDISVQPSYDTLWAQVIRVGDLPVPVSTEINCADCHCDTCDATAKHLTNPSRDGKTSNGVLHDFLDQGQYAPLLIMQRNN
jgi:hypothetical protein